MHQITWFNSVLFQSSIYCKEFLLLVSWTPILPCLNCMSLLDMSHFMRKPALCISEKKGADQLHGDCAVDQRLYFCKIPLLSKSKISSLFSLAIFCGHTARVVSDLVRNPEDRFSPTRLILPTLYIWISEFLLEVNWYNSKRIYAIFRTLWVTIQFVFLKAHVKKKTWLNHNVIKVFLLLEPCHEKTNVLVSNLVRHKPGCTATEDG